MDKELISLLDSYEMPAPAVELLQKARVAFVVGISGAGKNTILKELLKNGKYRLIISHTTRQPRENHGVLERDGEDYHFIDGQTAMDMLKNDEFIEAKVYSGNVYGTSLEEVKKAYAEGKIAISDIEVQGVSEYMKKSSLVTPVFILPPDFDTWQKRLKVRYAGKQPDKTDMKKRMETAKKELEEALSKDYFEFVVNDDLFRTVTAVDEITHGNLSAEKNDQARQLAQELLEKLN
jgi:guanylate kinase